MRKYKAISGCDVDIRDPAGFSRSAALAVAVNNKKQHHHGLCISALSLSIIYTHRI